MLGLCLDPLLRVDTQTGQSVATLLAPAVWCNHYGTPFVHQRARIQIPWNLILHHQACLGDRANAYSLGVIEIEAGATVAQEVYLCTGTHAFDQPAMNLVTSPITIGANSFIGARAFIMPGVSVGRRAIVGACSVVTRNVAPGSTVAGTPARQTGR